MKITTEIVKKIPDELGNEEKVLANACFPCVQKIDAFGLQGKWLPENDIGRASQADQPVPASPNTAAIAHVGEEREPASGTAQQP